MKFNTLIREILWPIFNERGFIIEENNDNVRFKSRFTEVFLSYDKREKSFMFCIGKVNEFPHALDRDALKLLFGNSVKLDNSSMDNYVNDISFLFKNQAKSLLNDDLQKLDLLRIYSEKRAREYTNNILEKQNRQASDKAWKNQNYVDFIKYLNKIEKQNWSNSERLKYEMASKRVEK